MSRYPHVDSAVEFEAGGQILWWHRWISKVHVLWLALLDQA